MMAKYVITLVCVITLGCHPAFPQGKIGVLGFRGSIDRCPLKLRALTLSRRLADQWLVD